MDQAQAELHFGCFDPEAELEISHSDLPHWFQPSTAMFVTFRTADSMPDIVWHQWRDELAEWLQRQKLPTALAETRGGLELLTQQLLNSGTGSIAQLREFRRLRDRLWHRKLDELHGECLLRNTDLAQIVGDALRFYDGDKYDLDRFVVMPNHVHVLVQFRNGSTLEVIGQSWLRYTGRKINAAVGRKGAFWQGEPFDHLVRSPEQFVYFQQYIDNNPAQARLSPGSYLLWHR